MKKSNERHPEMRHGEKFLKNATDREFTYEICYRTKRMGCRAFDDDGNDIGGNGQRPIFVQASELE